MERLALRRLLVELSCDRREREHVGIPIAHGMLDEVATDDSQPKTRIWGVARVGVDEDELDRRSWENSTASDRFDAALTLSLLAWSLSHAKDAPIGLRGAAGG